jgi:hypothetical protein
MAAPYGAPLSPRCSVCYQKGWRAADRHPCKSFVKERRSAPSARSRERAPLNLGSAARMPCLSAVVPAFAQPDSRHDRRGAECSPGATKSPPKKRSHPQYCVGCLSTRIMCRRKLGNPNGSMSASMSRGLLRHRVSGPFAMVSYVVEANAGRTEHFVADAASLSVFAANV